RGGSGGDGWRVAVARGASDLVDNVTNGPGGDSFERDLLARRTFLLSSNVAGTGSGSGDSGRGALAMTPDGGLVLFDSNASDLAPNDTNGPLPDVFIAAPARAPPPPPPRRNYAVHPPSP